MSHDPNTASPVSIDSVTPSDRRRAPRIQILGQLHGHVVCLDVPITLRDISLGGMMIETPFAIPIGASNLFRLTLGDGTTTIVTARVVHCHRMSGTDVARYASGVEFVEDAAEAVDELIDRLA